MRRSNSQSSHNIYVVELDKKVWSESKKFRDANPHYKGILECLYVGMTSHTPLERYRKHKTGHRTRKGHDISSRFVKKYGIFLRPSLYSSYNPMSRQKALHMESAVANSLRKKGYAVWWN